MQATWAGDADHKNKMLAVSPAQDCCVLAVGHLQTVIGN